MSAPYSIRGFLNTIAGTVALTTVLACGAVAQAPSDGGAKPGGGQDNNAPKSGAGDAGSASKSSGAPSDEALSKIKITLTAEQQNVSDALRSLMKSAKLDFAIDNDLKDGTITVHFKEVPFKDALTTMIKVSTIPITYEVKDGIYHFSRRILPPPEEEKPGADNAKPSRPRFQADKVPVEQLSSTAALRKLTGAYDTPPPHLYQHSEQPFSHGSTSSFGLGSNGILQSNGFKYNPDGSISRTGGNPINLFNLLRGLLGGLK